MGLFQKIFGYDDTQEKEKENLRGYFKTLTAYTPAFTTWDGALYESELVRSAIDARARHISKLKIEFTGSATGQLITNLRRNPNRFQTWSQFLYRTSTILDVTNNCWIVPTEDGNGKTDGYIPILPQKTELVRDENDDVWLRYKFANNTVGVIEYDRAALLTKHQYYNDFFGDNNRALDDTMKLIHLQNEGIEDAVKNSATIRFTARVNNFTKTDDLARERDRFAEANLRGNANNGGILLFPNVYSDIKQVESKPYTVDAEQMEQIRTNVFNYFAVNEDVLQSKAFGDSWSAFYESVCEVFAIQFSDTMTKTIFSPFEISNGNSVIATANRLQYLSNSDKLAVSSQMADRGLMTINEIREIWNLPPFENGDVPVARGEYYTQENLTEGENDEGI